jgi:N-acetylglucosaminyldiphosphoundecaprenol N-acetyl-beta-D-mannosaminyltransferase
MKEIEIFRIRVHPLFKSEFLQIIDSNLRNGYQLIQSGVNAASINEVIKNDELVQSYNNSDLVNIDGISMVWALRFLGYYVPERVACPDLANDILALAEKQNYSIFLLGAKDNVVNLCVQKLKSIYPNLRIAGFRNGYFSKEEEGTVLEMINNASPDILFLGMPSPRKELFVEKYKNQLSAKYTLGVGGYFDILSGLTRRAPKWIQNIGMEWFFRFLQEPKRMWHRYLIGNLKFIWLVIKEKVKGHKN